MKPIGGLSGHGSLQQLLGRTSHPIPKRKRDAEDEHTAQQNNNAASPAGRAAQGASSSSSAGSKPGSSRSRKKPMTNQQPWDWSSNKPKPCPKPPTAPAPATSKAARSVTPASPGYQRSSPRPQGLVSPPNQDGSVTLTCPVAGRRHRRHSQALDEAMTGAGAGAGVGGVGVWVAAEVQREPTNPVDSRAIQILLPASDGLQGTNIGVSIPSQGRYEDPRLIGHIPSRISAYLAPLIDKDLIRITARIAHVASAQRAAADAAAGGGGAPAPRALRVRLQCRVRDGVEPFVRQEVMRELCAAEGVAKQLMENADAGLGLRNTMVSMVASIKEVDTHLFTPSELDTMARLVALPPPHLSLLLRLFFRRGPWFALSDVYEYKEVDDVQQCGLALIACGFLEEPRTGDCSALLDVLNADKAREVAAALSITGVSKSAPRPDLDQALLKTCDCTRTATQRCMERCTSRDRPPLTRRLSAPSKIDLSTAAKPDLSSITTIDLSTGIDDDDQGGSEGGDTGLVPRVALRRYGSEPPTPSKLPLPAHTPSRKHRPQHDTSVGKDGVADSPIRIDLDSSTPTQSQQGGVQGGTHVKGGVQGGTLTQGGVQGGTLTQGGVQGGTQSQGATQSPFKAAAMALPAFDAPADAPLGPQPVTGGGDSNGGVGGRKGLHAAGHQGVGTVTATGDVVLPRGVQRVKQNSPVGQGSHVVIDLTIDDDDTAATATATATATGAAVLPSSAATTAATGSATGAVVPGPVARSGPQRPSSQPATTATATAAPEAKGAATGAPMQRPVAISQSQRAMGQAPATNGTVPVPKPAQGHMQGLFDHGGVSDDLAGIGTGGVGLRPVQCRLQRQVVARAGVCVRVAPPLAQLIRRMQRVFFLNEAHDMNRWVAADRGAIPYPSYKICRAHSAFTSRQALLDYETALTHAALLDDCLTSGDAEGAEHALQPAWAALAAGDFTHITWTEHATHTDTPPTTSTPVTHTTSVDPCQDTAQPVGPPVDRTGGKPHIVSRPEGARAKEAHSEGMHAAVNVEGGPDVSRYLEPVLADSPQPGQVAQPADGAVPTADTGANTGGQQQPAVAVEAEGAQANDECGMVVGAGNSSVGPRPLYLARFCSAWVYAGMCTVGVSLLEKGRRYEEAVSTLRGLLEGKCCPGRRGEWWLRLSIDLEHQGDDEGALVAAEQALRDPWVRHGDLMALQRRVLRLGKPPRRWKRPAWSTRVLSEPPEVVIKGRPLAMKTGIKSRFYAFNGKEVSVEDLALEYYSSTEGGEWQGLHCEGGVWACLWGLLLWDEIFSDVEDVFRTPCQTAPLDIDTDAFYPARSERIDKRLQEIADGQAEQILASCWEAHHGQWCRGVNWERYTLTQLQEIARCVGGLGLSVVCRMLSEDFSGWRGGMPDLLLWRPAALEAKLSEVKGPRDRLSDAQRAWIAALSDVGMRCEVLRVQEPS